MQTFGRSAYGCALYERNELCAGEALKKLCETVDLNDFSFCFEVGGYPIFLRSIQRIKMMPRFEILLFTVQDDILY